MTLRVCMVTPFASSRPHPVNEHVSAAARALRARAMRSSCSRRRTGRRISRRAAAPCAASNARAGRSRGTVAVSPRCPSPGEAGWRPRRRARQPDAGALPRRRSTPCTRTIRAFRACRISPRHGRGLTVATFHSVERLAYLPGKAQRERLLARTDALTATSPAVAEAAARRFPGDYRVLPLGVDAAGGGEAGATGFVIEWRADESDRLRAALRALAELTGFELVVPLAPVRSRAVPIPARCAAGCTSGWPSTRPPVRGSSPRRRIRAGDRGRRADRRRGRDGGSAAGRSTRLGGAARARRRSLARLAEDSEHRRVLRGARESARDRRRSRSARHSSGSTGRSSSAGGRPTTPTSSPTAPGSSATSTCTPTTRTTARWPSRTSSTTRRPRASVRSRSPTTTSSPRARRSSFTRGRALTVIPGEEVKTDQGEVIALPRGGDPPRHDDG